MKKPTKKQTKAVMAKWDKRMEKLVAAKWDKLIAACR